LGRKNGGSIGEIPVAAIGFNGKNQIVGLLGNGAGDFRPAIGVPGAQDLVLGSQLEW
jgi:hypothetical protein